MTPGAQRFTDDEYIIIYWIYTVVLGEKLNRSDTYMNWFSAHNLQHNAHLKKDLHNHSVECALFICATPYVDKSVPTNIPPTKGWYFLLLELQHNIALSIKEQYSDNLV